MRLINSHTLQFEEGLAYRPGYIAFKYLLEGEEKSPDNFSLVLANEHADFFSPRHRHAWDQVRYCVSGSVPIGPKLALDAGEVGYFPEGVYYGPQDGDKDRIVFVLQFGGASGNGFLGLDQIEAGRKALLKTGSFDGGVYKRHGQPGQQDGYEAIWEEVFGHKIVYPKPRYKAPILINPGHFDWREDPGHPGVSRKYLGTFSERKLEMELVRVAPGASLVSRSESARQFLLTTSGEGTCAGEAYAALAANQIEPGENIPMSAATETKFLRVVVPLLS